MVMAMKSGLPRNANSGENGEAAMRANAYPRIAMWSVRLSSAGKSWDEIAPTGRDSVALPRFGSYPDFVPSFPGIYP